MKSMTGYGRGESTREGFQISVEISSVNRKQAEIVVNLPRELDVLEAKVREEVNRDVTRGRVLVRVNVDTGGLGKLQVNHKEARAAMKEVRALAKELGIPEDVTIDQLLRLPGVMDAPNAFADAQSFLPPIHKALVAAMKDFMAMRAREGEHLKADLEKRMKAMQKAAKRVARQAPKVVKRYREQLSKRIEQAGLPLESIEEERLLKEVVIFADRSDISEEIARLESHFNQFDHYAGSKQAIGRTLDFLAQEMNREINTIGSKANDALIAKEVVTLKTELEKFREQAQNVE